MEEEREELAIADEFNNAKTTLEFSHLLRSGQIKEFYSKANALLKIRRTNPVVTRVQREDEIGELHTYEEKSAVDLQIAKYFTDIYKRPEYRRLAPSQIDFNVEDDAEIADQHG